MMDRRPKVSAGGMKGEASLGVKAEPVSYWRTATCTYQQGPQQNEASSLNKCLFAVEKSMNPLAL